MKIAHTRLLVADYPACFRFYHDILGLEARWGDENSGYASFAELGGEKPGLAIFERGAMAAELGSTDLPAEATCQDGFMLIVEVENVDETVRELSARGARFLGETQDYPGWGIRCAYLRDPDGALIEFNSALPLEDWSPELREASQKYW